VTLGTPSEFGTGKALDSTFYEGLRSHRHERARQWALWILLTVIVLAVFGFTIYLTLFFSPLHVKY
jgi:hypothetical protein